jgi:hypothetical protein
MSGGAVANQIIGGVRRGAGGKFVSDATEYQKWLARGAAKGPLEKLVSPSRRSGLAVMDPVQEKLARMEGLKLTESRPPRPPTQIERNLNKIREKRDRVRTAPAGGGGGSTPPPTAPAGAGGTGGAAPGDSSFWGTSAAMGMSQIAGMGLLGGAIGGASAWATGGNVGQGFVAGGLLGATGGVYNQQMMRSAGEGLRAGAARFGRQPGPIQPGGRVPLNPYYQEAYAAGTKLSRSSTPAAAMAAGAGLAGGMFFSGHRRKNVNGYNSRRGNYIGS